MQLKEVECPEPAEGLFYVYVLLCKNGSFYVGQSNHVQNRLEMHRQGRGSKHTKDNGVLYVVYIEGPLPLIKATQREKQIKGWSRTKKIKLITGER